MTNTKITNSFLRNLFLFISSIPSTTFRRRYYCLSMSKCSFRNWRLLTQTLSLCIFICMAHSLDPVCVDTSACCVYTPCLACWIYIPGLCGLPRSTACWLFRYKRGQRQKHSESIPTSQTSQHRQATRPLATTRGG